MLCSNLHKESAVVLVQNHNKICPVKRQNCKVCFKNGSLCEKYAYRAAICYNRIDAKHGPAFDRFYTVESASNSTGLGLAIAKTLVEQMRGEISAEYADGRLRIIIDSK